MQEKSYSGEFLLFRFFPIPDLNGYDLSQLIESNRFHATGWASINPIAAEWARKEFIIDFVVRDKAEALVANALTLGNFFIIVTVTHRFSPRLIFAIMTVKSIANKVWLFSEKAGRRWAACFLAVKHSSLLRGHSYYAALS